MYSFPRATMQTLVQVLKPQAPPHLLPLNTTVHTAVEGPGTIVIDQVHTYIKTHVHLNHKNCMNTINVFVTVYFTCLPHSVYPYPLCRHSHRGCTGGTGQTQRREDGIAHANQETLSFCPVSYRYLHTPR